MMEMQADNIKKYFATARHRYGIRLKKIAGEPFPWSQDSIFSSYYFCNVHREHDKTTEWFRDNVRNHLSGQKVIEATVIFRWFNRIETGEIIKDLLLEGWDSDEAYRRLRTVTPIVTGAYMIKTVSGMNKLNGALYAINNALPILRSMKLESSLQGAHRQLREIKYLGGFMSYEVVSDLRWTDVLRDAPDILTWANAGPGAARGLTRLIMNKPSGLFRRTSREDQEKMNDLMQDLWEYSQDPNYWPQDWTPWEMREVEHWLCEYDKYMRVYQDGVPMKRRYRA